MTFWKPVENYQIIEISSMKKNKKPLNTNANKFRARPLQHYRKQYDTNTSSRYQQLSHSGFYYPGGYIVKSNKVENSNDCAGHVFSADYMLNKDYNIKTEKRICDGKKLIRVPFFFVLPIFFKGLTEFPSLKLISSKSFTKFNCCDFPVILFPSSKILFSPIKTRFALLVISSANNLDINSIDQFYF